MGGSKSKTTKCCLHTEDGADSHGHNVDSLIKAGTDVNKQDERGQTALHLAVCQDRGQVPKDLFRDGADVNKRDKKGHIIGSLIKAGVDVNKRDKKGKTAVHMIDFHKKNQWHMIERLLTAGLDINAQDENGTSVLHLAVYSCLTYYTESLIEAGACINVQNKEGETPLHKAVLFCRPNNVDALINAGADLNQQERFGSTALHVAIQNSDRKPYRKPGYARIIDSLLKAGADIDIQDKDGRTALHGAAHIGGNTALHLAAERHSQYAMSDLIHSGENKNVTGQKFIQHYVMSDLLRAGADIDILNHKGYTAYQIDSMARYEAAVTYLLKPTIKWLQFQKLNLYVGTFEKPTHPLSWLKRRCENVFCDMQTLLSLEVIMITCFFMSEEYLHDIMVHDRDLSCRLGCYMHNPRSLKAWTRYAIIQCFPPGTMHTVGDLRLPSHLKEYLVFFRSIL